MYKQVGNLLHHTLHFQHFLAPTKKCLTSFLFLLQNILKYKILYFFEYLFRRVSYFMYLHNQIQTAVYSQSDTEAKLT